MNKYIHTTLRGTLTAIMMMVGISVWAEGEVAQIGETKYTTLQDAINAATDGQTISLIQDINETVANTANANSFTIDLGEHTWTYTQTENDFAALKQDNTNSVITLKNGTMVVSGTEGFNVWARNGKVIIESGNYSINSKEDYNIYATTGYVEIYGGVFTNSNTDPYNHNASLKSLNLNVHNTLSTVEHIKVFGGTFTADPSKGDDSAWGASTFVASGYIVKTHESTPQTTYTVEPEVKIEVNLTDATQAQTDAATALAGNTSVSKTTGLGDNGSLDVSITNVTLGSDNTTVTSASFNVTPKDANGNTITVFSGTYTFRLPITNSVAADKWVNLKHNSTPIRASQVVAENANKFVTVTTYSFSPFEYQVLLNDPVAQIGETKYETMTEAIAAATAEETTIEILADITTAFEVTSGKNIKLTIGTHKLSGAITNNGTLTISDGTISGNITNTGTLNISGGAISGNITNTGTISITGGTFTQKPEAGWIAENHEVMVGAEGKYVVAAIGTAEAKIVTTVGEVETTTLYQTIADAIAAVSTEAEAKVTTIVVLKDITNDFTIVEGQKIALSVASHTISGAITNSGTLTISDGTFTGEITNSGTLTITGGTFTNKPDSYTCPDGKDLIINAEGKYEVTDITSAEAQIGEDMYLTIDKAITAAGTDETTITLLKDLEGEDRSITIPATADITLVIADGKTLTKPVNVVGKLAITSGAISEKTTIAITNFNAVLKISASVTHPAVALSTALQTDNVLKSKAEGEPVVTTYWAEKKFEATIALTGEPTTEQTDAAKALIANTSIKEVTGHATNQSLTITVTSVEVAASKVMKATFEVKLIGADGEAVTGTVDPAVTFHLPVSDGLNGQWANLWHNTTAIPGMDVVGATNGYVSVTTTSFSPFSYEIIETPIAQIGETKFGTVANAITAAPDAEATEIILVGTEADVTEAITVGTNKNVKLTIGTHTLSGNITNAGTLTIADGTIEGDEKTITNTGALTISGTANISNPVTATASSLTISGGTINNTITTSDAAGLTISDGIINGALTVGGSGTNTISGGTISGAVTTNAATVISGGEITNDITNSAALTITGGTFTGTITNTGTVAISGGTHTKLPVPSFCATGYMPITNEAGKYNMTKHWTITDATVIDGSHFEYLTSDAGYKVATATYHRNTGMVSAGNAETKYGTICLPFDITAAPTGMTLYKATEINATTLTISPITYTEPVAAGTPLIFELTNKASHMTVTSTNDGGIAVNTTAPATSPVTTPEESKNLLVGTYVKKTIDSGLPGNIYYLNGDTFHQALQSLTVPAFRAYLDTTPSGSAKPMVLSIMKEGEEGVTTGISALETLEGVTAVYDLNGRKQSGLQKGMNILRRADGSTLKVLVK